jgi:hypothetical protein
MAMGEMMDGHAAFAEALARQGMAEARAEKAEARIVELEARVADLQAAGLQTINDLHRCYGDEMWPYEQLIRRLEEIVVGVPKLKAWQVNEGDIYAAATLEDAIACAMETMRVPRAEVYDPIYAGEVPMSRKFTGEDPEKFTIRELLYGIDEPRFLVSIET